MRILLSWILCGFLVMWAPVTAQISQQPFTLSISVEEDPAVQSSLENYTVKAGSEVFITVHLTNISKHNLALDIDADSRTGICFAHQYEVRDINGKFAPNGQSTILSSVQLDMVGPLASLSPERVLTSATASTVCTT